MKLGPLASNDRWAGVNRGFGQVKNYPFIVVVISLNLVRLASTFLQLSKIATGLCTKIPIFVTWFVY